MVFLEEYIKLRTEQSVELTHLELDHNLQFVANPWNNERAYLQGMVVYHSDDTTASTDGIGNLTWYRANKDVGPEAFFDPADWDPIGANAATGSIIVKDSGGVFSTVGVVEMSDDFTVTFLGNTATIDVSPGAFSIWQELGDINSTISYADPVLIGTASVIDSTYTLSVAGHTLITGDLVVAGLINGIDLVGFYNDYNIHTHTLVPTTLTNYTSLYPNSNGQIEDIQITSLQDGDFLQWSNSLKRWVNTTIAVGSHNLGNHADVNNAVSIAPQSEQVIVYNNGTGLWENRTLIQNGSTGFLGTPFAHDHDDRYYTKTELLASSGSLINFDNLFNVPASSPANAPYIVASLTGSLSAERALTQGTGIVVTDNGGNNTIVVEQDPATVLQLSRIRLDDVAVADRPGLNFVTPTYTGLTVTVTDNIGTQSVDVAIDFTAPIPTPAPVLSVNGYIGIVNLGVSDMIDVSLTPGLFPGAGTGSPLTPGTNILAYDDDINSWVNVPVSTLIAGVSGIFLDDILDVEIASTPLLHQDILYWDEFAQRWVNGNPNDANLYTITDLQAGALNSLYYTETELNTSGGGSVVHWDNLISVPSFAPFNHTHYVWELQDVLDYSGIGGINDGDVLVWNAVNEYWEATTGGGSGGFSTVINNSNDTGIFTAALDTIINPSNLIPLQFQADVGVFLETDVTKNIIKIGVAVDNLTIGYNSSGELEVIYGGGGGSCFNYTFATLTKNVDNSIAHGLGTDNIVIGIYDDDGWLITIDAKVTSTEIILHPSIDFTNIKVVAAICFEPDTGGGGTGDIDYFGDLVTSTPTDGTFADGVFQWTDNTKIIDAFDDLNELLAALAPPTAPQLTDWSGLKAGIDVTGKLSFDDSNPIAGASYVGGNNAPSAVNVDGTWTVSGKRLGIAPSLAGDVTGVLNDQVPVDAGLPFPAYLANSFGAADQGVLNLYVNGTLVSTLDLTSSISAIDNTSGGTISGFSVSAQSASVFPNGNAFPIFQNRTGTYIVTDDDINLVQGYNYLTAEHVIGVSISTLTRFEFIIDDNVNATAYSNESLYGLVMAGSKRLSGIDYHTSGTAQYDLDIDNAYRNTYSSSASAVSFIGNTSGTYGVMCSAPSQALANCSGNELLQVNISGKLATITPSGVRIIDDQIAIITRVDRTVQSDLLGGSDNILNILLDNVAPTSTLTFEGFDNETYRLNTNSSYDTIASVTAAANLWDSDQSLFDGSVGHLDGLQIIGGQLVYPGNHVSYPADFQTSAILNGSAYNDGGTGGTGRTYGSCIGIRKYIRQFRKVTPTTANFVMNIAGSGGTFVSTGTALIGNNIHVEIKGPTETGWMDAYGDFSTGNFSDGDGARNATAGAGRTFGSNWGLTIGTKNTANTGGYMVIRISVSSTFTGNINDIDWTFS